MKGRSAWLGAAGRKDKHKEVVVRRWSPRLRGGVVTWALVVTATAAIGRTVVSDLGLWQRPARAGGVVEAVVDVGNLRMEWDADGWAVLGDAGATSVLVEFSDFECPFCGRHWRDTMPRIREEYIATGRIMYMVRNLPLVGKHALALGAAQAAECAARGGRYWEMHERLFESRGALTAADLEGYGDALGLGDEFDRCLAGPVRPEIGRDGRAAERLGVTGTPTFFVGVIENETTLRVRRRINGAQAYDVFRNELDAVIEEGVLDGGEG